MWEKLREFGLEYCDLPTMLWNVTAMLRVVALDVDPRHKHVIFCGCYYGTLHGRVRLALGHFFIFPAVGFLPYLFLIFISVCYYYVYFVSMLWFVFVRCRETGELFAAIVVFSLEASSEISMTKLWCLFVQRKNLRKLIAAFLICDDQVAPNSRFADNMKSTLRAVKKRAIIVWSVIIWNGIIYIAIPICMPERYFMEDKFEFIGFENMATMRKSPYYEFAFTINCVGVFVTCYPSANISALFIIIAGYIEAQMLALSQELSNVWEDALKHCQSNSFRVISHLKDSNTASVVVENISGDSRRAYAAWSRERVTSRALGHVRNTSTAISSYNSSITENESTKNFYEETMNQSERNIALNRYVRKRLEDILKTHSTNIDLLRQVEGVYRVAIAFEFMLLSIGLIAELLGGLEKTYIQVPFALMSVSIDCLTGQRIKDASTAFENAVYDSKWENFDISNRKIILLMIRSSQKTMKLSAGGVATLSLECLMVVLKTTYSAYTTLRSTMK